MSIASLPKKKKNLKNTTYSGLVKIIIRYYYIVVIYNHVNIPTYIICKYLLA